MFLSPSGRKILVLHSYRDSLGRVRQRRLGSFSDRAGMEQQWDQLEQHFPRQLRRLAQLRQQAEAMLEKLEPKSQARPREREAEARRHARALLRLLQQGSLKGPEFTALQARLAAQDTTLEDLAEDKMDQGQHGECADILSFDPPKDRETASRRAALWVELGLAEEGLRLLDQLPQSDGWAQLNRAALQLHLGRGEDALATLSKGLALEPSVLADLERLRQGRPAQGYWRQFAHLWDEKGRDFLMRLWKQTLVRVRTFQARDGARFYTLIKPRSRGWLLERAWGECQHSAESSACRSHSR